MPVFDIFTASGNAIEALFFTPSEIEIANDVVSAQLFQIRVIFATYSIHLHGSAGIQYSVLSFEISN